MSQPAIGGMDHANIGVGRDSKQLVIVGYVWHPTVGYPTTHGNTRESAVAPRYDTFVFFAFFAGPGRDTPFGDCLTPSF
jgi:hypothetical protein